MVWSFFACLQDLQLAVNTSLAFMLGGSLVHRVLSYNLNGAAALNTFVHQTKQPSNGTNAPDLNTLVSTAVVDVSGGTGEAGCPHRELRCSHREHRCSR